MVLVSDIELGGVSAVDIYVKAIEGGISKKDASELVGSWLLANANKTRRTFAYQTDFPATEADCVSHFARTFVHHDWQDGQDLVQAEQSAGEDGFNFRFHKIENDLDGLGADVAEVFLCLADMRLKLRALLDELKLELNTIEGDIADLKACCENAIGSVPVRVGGNYVGSTKFLGESVDVFKDSTGHMVVTPGIIRVPGGGVTDPESRLNRVQDFAKYAVEAKRFQALFKGKAVTKEQVLRAVGGDVVGGSTVEQLLEIMPPGAKYSSADAWVNAVAQDEGLALRTSGAADAALVSAFGFETTVESVANAAITDFQALPETARSALASGGVTSVGALAKLSSSKLLDVLKQGGVTGVSAGEAAGWAASAKALMLVR